MLYAAQRQQSLQAFEWEVVEASTLMHRHSAMMEFFLLQLVGFLQQMHAPRNLMLNLIGDRGLAFLFLVDAFVEDESDNVNWNELLQPYWCNRKRRRFIYREVASSHRLRLAILRHGMEPVCRRKDRKLIELLFRMEPYPVVTVHLTRIIDQLEATRGKTERILGYLRAVSLTSLQKARVLERLLKDTAVDKKRRDDE
jgi:hypothetical protein